MIWVTIIWAMIASACLALALVHVLVWWRRPNARANLLFALSAVATAVYGGCELWMMRAIHAPITTSLFYMGIVAAMGRSSRQQFPWKKTHKPKWLTVTFRKTK